jgi:hypothetical protein
VHDTTVAPAGFHTMSVFAQYVPYTFRDGTWDTRRDEVRALALRSIGRFCSNLDRAVVDAQVLGPPDIEAKVGLTGGHIFQGECLPPYMWSNRLSARTPMPGVYLCGACTHPGGSVIAINGRNAAMAVLADQSEPSSSRPKRSEAEGSAVLADRAAERVPHVSSRRGFDGTTATPNASDPRQRVKPGAPPAPLPAWQIPRG